MKADPCEDPTWRTTGFQNAADYRFWAPRICGLACLRSALDFWQIAHGSVSELLTQATEHGCYIRYADGRVEGLIYAPFATWLESAFAVKVEVLGHHSLEKLLSGISAGGMAVASVSPEIRDPSRPASRRGGHLVLVTGMDRGGLWIHNPSGLEGTQSNLYISRANFQRFFGERGMILHRPAGEIPVLERNR